MNFRDLHGNGNRRTLGTRLQDIVPMLMRPAIMLLCAIPLLPSAAAGTKQPISALSNLPPACAQAAESGPQTNDLVRYCHLLATTPRLSGPDQLTARQLIASAEDELGLYNNALIDFPFDIRIVVPAKVPLPTPDNWHPVDAAEMIAAKATHRRIVMINEAHHDAHTRVLTLELLPRLYARGFRYLAIEALGNKDPALMKRGYVVPASGSEYLHEPLYGEIVRQAIRLGYTLVPYDSNAQTIAAREAEQASNIYRRVFAKDPQARLLVHAGYAHIDKAAGDLGDGISTMAMHLKLLTGLDPLAVDQTQFRDVNPGTPDPGAYGILLQSFHPRQPIVLRNNLDGVMWSSDPTRFDISVILPPSDTNRRPHWLSLDGHRKPQRVNTDMCTGHMPCVVQANYADEPDEATAADRLTFMQDGMPNVLYLYPGKYRLRAWSVDDKTLSQRDLEVGKP